MASRKLECLTSARQQAIYLRRLHVKSGVGSLKGMDYLDLTNRSSQKQYQEEVATRLPGHHFFGFHDLVAWNAVGDKLLTLEVQEIDHPPLPGQPAKFGFLTSCGEFISLGETCAWNFPQGARQQWLGETEQFIVNDRGVERWVSHIYDASAQKCIETLPGPIHALNSKKGEGFFIDYSRLHRLGGYGYTGIRDEFDADAAPSRSGIFRLHLASGKLDLMVSLREVANHAEGSRIEAGIHHYITHLLLNPANDRLAFLHRYPMADGGQMTRLMTIGAEGNNLRCLARGFLSHFDWRSDNEIVIWGRQNESIAKYRSKIAPNNQLSKFALSIVKRMAKKLLSNSPIMQMSYLQIKDCDTREISSFARNAFTTDGHLMFCPANRDWLVNDTYPNSEGVRTLILYRASADQRIDLGQYKMLQAIPDMHRSRKAMHGVDQSILKQFKPELYAFTRSGLHCDLHPRWKGDGTQIAFDSIHEGHRQLYVYKVGHWVKP